MWQVNYSIGKMFVIIHKIISHVYVSLIWGTKGGKS